MKKVIIFDFLLISIKLSILAFAMPQAWIDLLNGILAIL